MTSQYERKILAWDATSYSIKDQSILYLKVIIARLEDVLIDFKIKLCVTGLWSYNNLETCKFIEFKTEKNNFGICNYKQLKAEKKLQSFLSR